MNELNKPPYFNEPYELGCGEVYNFCLQFPIKLNSKGELIDVEGFKHSLIGNIRKPLSGEELDKGIKQSVIGKIKIYGLILKANSEPVAFHYRKIGIEKLMESYRSDETLLETYIIERENEKVLLKGEHDFNLAQEDAIFNCIAHCFGDTSPFDDLPDGKNIENFLGELYPDIFPFARKNRSND